MSTRGHYPRLARPGDHATVQLSRRAARRPLWRAGFGALTALALIASACTPAAPASPTAAPAPAATTAPTTAPAKPATSPAATTAPASAPTASAAPSPSPAAKPATSPSPSPAAAPVLPKPEKTAIKIGYSTLEAATLTYPFAVDNGIFKKYGVDVEIAYFEGDARALQVLFAEQVDASTQGVSVAISSLLTETPLVVTSMTSTVLTDALVARSDIKSANDLRGKPIAVSAFGGTSHGAVLLSLQALGLTENDVVIQQVGGQAARVAALKSGAVAAAPIDVSLESEMKDQGFNILVRLPDTGGQYARGGLIFRREFYEKNPNTVLALNAAILDAQQQLFKQKDKAVDSYMKWLQITDRAKAEKEVSDFLGYTSRGLWWKRDAFEQAKKVLASQNPALADVDVSKAYTFDVLERLVQLGVYDAVGAPKEH